MKFLHSAAKLLDQKRHATEAHSPLLIFGTLQTETVQIEAGGWKETGFGSILGGIITGPGGISGTFKHGHRALLVTTS